MDGQTEAAAVPAQAAQRTDGFPSDVAFTPAVKAEQERRGSRRAYARMEQGAGWATSVDDRLRAFLAERDSFYLATASADGQPYIQHRGGPAGFLRVLDDRTLGFADFGGNRQYISIGNLAENDRAHIFLMDYARRRRIKIWGRLRVVEDDPVLLGRLTDTNYGAVPERAFVFTIEAWDSNCPQHIVPRLSAEELAPTIQQLQLRIAQLEAALAEARS